MVCDYSIADNAKYSPKVQIEGKVGNRRGIVRPASLIPIYQQSDSLIHLSLIGMSDTKSAFEANFGLGARHLIDKNIFGLYGFYDIRRSTRDNIIHQATLGIEWFRKFFEFRFNLYIPKKRNFAISEFRNVLSYSKKSGSTVDIELKSFKKVEQALPGFDIDIGTQLPSLPELTVRAAYFRFASSDKHIQTRNGFRGVIGYQLYKFIQLDGEISYDNQRKLVYFGGVTIGYNFDNARKRFSSLTRLEQKMNSLPIRDVDAITATGYEQKNSIGINVNCTNDKTSLLIIEVSEYKGTAQQKFTIISGKEDFIVTSTEKYGDKDIRDAMQRLNLEKDNFAVILIKSNEQEQNVYYVDKLSHLHKDTNINIKLNGSNNLSTVSDGTIQEAKNRVAFLTGVDLLRVHQELEDKLQKKIAEAKKIAEDKRILNQKLKEKIIELARNKQSLLANMKKFQEQQRLGLKELEDERENVSQLEDEIENMKQQISILEREKIKIRRRRHSVMLTNNSVDTANLVSQLAMQRSTANRKERENIMLQNSRQQEIIDLKKQVLDLESSLKDARDTVVKKQQDMNRLEKLHNETLISMQKSLQNGISSSTKDPQINPAVEENKKLRKQLQLLIRGSSNLQEALNNIRLDLRNRDQKISDLNSSLEFAKKSREEQIRTLNQKMEVLKQKHLKKNAKLKRQNEDYVRRMQQTLILQNKQHEKEMQNQSEEYKKLVHQKQQELEFSKTTIQLLRDTRENEGAGMYESLISAQEDISSLTVERDRYKSLYETTKLTLEQSKTRKKKIMNIFRL